MLISPYALIAVNKEEQYITINLTQRQIEDSQSLDSDKTVSRQFEEDYYEYYGWTLYWDGPRMWGSYPAYPYIERDREKWRAPPQGENAWDLHLRRTYDVRGHHIQAEDGDIGNAEDFIIDDKTWTIRYLIINTQNWWPEKKVLVSPQWIEQVSWSESTVFVNLTREAIRQSPEYTEEAQLTRVYETGLHRHYDRKGYWIEDPVATEHAGRSKYEKDFSCMHELLDHETLAFTDRIDATTQFIRLRISERLSFPGIELYELHNGDSEEVIFSWRIERTTLEIKFPEAKVEIEGVTP